MTIYSNQPTFANIDPEYAAFIEKFKPKKTPDDCYTPDNIYEAVRDWACAKYGIDPASIVRPFWPGGDYERFDYPDGCFVLDNPPFSILSKIVKWYNSHGIKFFLFCPGMVTVKDCSVIVVAASVIYKNGANVATSFCTNITPGISISAASDLYEIVKEENDKNKRKVKGAGASSRSLPDHLVTMARVRYLSQHGVGFTLEHGEYVLVRKLDNCKDRIFGRGYLLCDSAWERFAAGEKKAMANAAEEKILSKKKPIELSVREKEIISMLNRRAALSDRERAMQRTLGQ